MTQHPSQRFVVPEVIQTSGMDCGVASLCALAHGLGRPVNYERLREACQTDVDGTSIDTIEDVACALGFNAEQVVVPADHALMDEAASLPAIAVITNSMKFPHFVVIWRRHGPWFQVMDPATGRRWIHRDRLRAQLFEHTELVEPGEVEAYFHEDEFLQPLRARIRALGLGRTRADQLADTAARAPGFDALCRLDAATRMVARLRDANAVRGARETDRVLDELSQPQHAKTMPESAWLIRAPHAQQDATKLQYTGAVLLRFRGFGAVDPNLSPNLRLALRKSAPKAYQVLWAHLREGASAQLILVAVALVLLAGSRLAESLLFRALIDVQSELAGGIQRGIGDAAIVVFALAVLAIEIPTEYGVRSLARNLEGRLRLYFFARLRRLPDEYFRSRPRSDMASRVHVAHRLRLGATLLAQAFGSVAKVSATVAALVWLEPSLWWLACAGGLGSIALPLLAQRALSEPDLKFEGHGGGLTRFYLDALVGLTAIQTHGAQASVRAEHEERLVEWVRSGRRLHHIGVAFRGLVAAYGFATSAAIVWAYTRAHGGSGGVLLVAYWSLSLPAMGQELATIARQYVTLRTTTLRLAEPLGLQIEEEVPLAPPTVRDRGIAIHWRNVTVAAGGQDILRGLDLVVAPGEHVAIVGRSGAGKSSMVSTIFGWLRPRLGTVEIDGELVTPQSVRRRKDHLVWIDPEVMLWNQSLLANVCYGHPQAAPRVPRAMDQAGLADLVAALEQGMQSSLGDGGGALSGGEGQRVRIARGLLGHDARLVVLDEPFRGLARRQRRQFAAALRRQWPRATVVYVTHDVADTVDFSRVAVCEGGRIVEAGSPAALLAKEGRYAELVRLDANAEVSTWAPSRWRRLRLSDGKLIESASP